MPSHSRWFRLCTCKRPVVLEPPSLCPRGSCGRWRLVVVKGLSFNPPGPPLSAPPFSLRPSPFRCHFYLEFRLLASRLFRPGTGSPAHSLSHLATRVAAQPLVGGSVPATALFQRPRPRFRDRLFGARCCQYRGSDRSECALSWRWRVRRRELCEGGTSGHQAAATSREEREQRAEATRLQQQVPR
ncbi:hypothetical protein NDU88_004996 [Pleurodeles waltl]|uniref:Uncharacterized protein n=1 Tax=Pleurodeles waltl TaxID=8319 RepID=A0AAV7RHA4_PLEWA|nr:hypothetical protein NDU88_004996 [Pleurodeles waltl]